MLKPMRKLLLLIVIFGSKVSILYPFNCNNVFNNMQMGSNDYKVISGLTITANNKNNIITGNAAASSNNKPISAFFKPGDTILFGNDINNTRSTLCIIFGRGVGYYFYIFYTACR